NVLLKHRHDPRIRLHHRSRLPCPDRGRVKPETAGKLFLRDALPVPRCPDTVRQGDGGGAWVVPEETDDRRKEAEFRLVLLLLPILVGFEVDPKLCCYILLPESPVKPPLLEVLADRGGVLGIARPRLPSSQGDM